MAERRLTKKPGSPLGGLIIPSTLTGSRLKVEPDCWKQCCVAGLPWSIATRSREASTSLCAYDASFGAGLIEAMTQVVSWRKAVALIAYDQPYPEPLHSARPLLASFGAALILTHEATGRTSATFELELLPGEEKPARMSDSALEELRLGIPAARSLPLLEALARNTQSHVVLDFLTETRLRVSVNPC